MHGVGIASMATTALLVMDFQDGIVGRLGDQAPPVLAAVNRATIAARSNDFPVVYVRVAFRPGTPEVSPRNKTFSALTAMTGMEVDDPATQIHDEVAPEPGEVVVVKKRISAFAGSDLDVVLRSVGATSLVLAGISTSGVVLSTIRQAADLDFELTVLRDACADQDDEVHRVLFDKVFPRQAEILDTDAWIATL